MLLDMQRAKRCGAKTRRGTECQSPAMPNGRCRMHGGKSPGAPKGNRNAWKHGYYPMMSTVALSATGASRQGFAMASLQHWHFLLVGGF